MQIFLVYTFTYIVFCADMIDRKKGKAILGDGFSFKINSNGSLIIFLNETSRG